MFVSSRAATRLFGFAMFGAFVAGCGTSTVELGSAEGDVDPDPAVTADAVATSSTTTAGATSTTSTSTSSTTTVPAVLPELVVDETGVPVNGQTRGVLLTDTGWVTPILSGLPDGRHRVWTPCGRQADIGGGRVVFDTDIVIDPGHGGSEPGAVGVDGLAEKNLNLAVSRRIRDALLEAGYTVVLTREGDDRVPIVTRAEIGRALDPVAFLSVHFNAGTEAPSPTPGTEMYHQIDRPDSRRLAGLLYEEARAVLDRYDVAWVALSDAGTMVRPNRDGDDYYGVLRRPGPVTSVLLEFAYLSNPPEERLVSDPDVQDALASSVVEAVTRYLQTDDPGSGFVDDPIFRGYGPSGAGRTDDCVDPALE